MGTYTNKFVIKGDTKSLQQELLKLGSRYDQTMQGIAESTLQVSLAEKKLAEATKRRADAVNTQGKTKAYASHKKEIQELQQLVIVEKKRTAALRSSKKYIEDAIVANKNRIASLNSIATSQKKTTEAIRKSTVATRAITKANRGFGVSLGNSSNELVRHIRRLESYAVALYTIKRGFDVTLGAGHEFNKIIEQETIGLKLLISQNLAKVNSEGKVITSAKRYALAQSEANKAIKIAREVNLSTPHSFAETLQIFKLLTPQVLKLGGSLEEVGTITQRMSVIAQSMGIEYQQFLKTVDSALSGEMKESGLKRALEQFGVTNEGIKEIKARNGDVISYVISGLEQAKNAGVEIIDSWAGATSQFRNEWDDLWGTIQKPLFDTLKTEIKDYSKLIKENKDEIVSFVDGIETLGGHVVSLGEAYLTLKVITAGYNKALAISSAIQLSNARAVGMSHMAALNYGKVISANTIRIRSMGIALKGLVSSNLPLLGLIAAFETWNYITGEITKKEEKLTKILALKNHEFKKLSLWQAQDNLNTLTRELQSHRETTQELRTQLTIQKNKTGIKSEEYVAQKVVYDTHLQTTTEIKNQIAGMNSVLDGTYKAGNAMYQTANAASAITKNLKNASNQAYTLANILIKAKLARGEITAREGIDQSYANEIKKINEIKDADKQRVEAIKAFEENKTALYNLDKTNIQKAKQAEESLRQAKIANLTAHGNTSQVTALKITQINDKNISDAQKELEINTLITNEKKSQAKASSRGGSASSKQINKDIKLLRRGMKDVAKENEKLWKDVGESFVDSIIKGDIAGAFKKLFTDGLDMLIPGLGKAAALIGSLFSTHVTQAEIDKATGRSDFSDESLQNLTDAYINAQYPMLEVTNKMSKYLRSMDNNFYAVARAITGSASTAGVDLTGANIVDTLTEGFLGFSSKSVTLKGTGIAFDLQYLGEMMDVASLSVRSYTTKLVEESSWWGLSSSSSVQTSYKSLPSGVKSDIADIFSNGYLAIMTAGVTLGLNEANLEEALRNAKINIGKIDFKGLSQQEVSDRFNLAISEAFSGIIMGIDEFTGLITRYATGAEEALETLGRIALEFDQASHMFGLIGKDFSDGGVIQVAKQVTTTIEATTSGIFSGFVDGISGFYERYESVNTLSTESGTSELSGIWGRFFGKNKEAIEEFSYVWVDAVYTSQMQILDIVESAGGLESFQDAMGSFMGGFYTESEQLGFLTKSMETSFRTLGLAMPKTNSEFRSLLEGMDTSTEEGSALYGQVLLLAEGFNAMTEATANLGTSMEDMIQQVSDAWLGNLSYLTLMQKAEYANGLVQLGLTDSTGAISSVDAARAAAEIALKTTSTKEEYIPVFERYIAELEGQVEDASRTDLLNELKELKSEVVELREVTLDASIHTGATA